MAWTPIDSVIIADNSRGTYAAQFIAQYYDVHGISREDIASLQAGPDCEDYCEASERLLSHGLVHLNGQFLWLDVTENGDWLATI